MTISIRPFDEIGGIILEVLWWLRCRCKVKIDDQLCGYNGDDHDNKFNTGFYW